MSVLAGLMLMSLFVCHIIHQYNNDKPHPAVNYNANVEDPAKEFVSECDGVLIRVDWYFVCLHPPVFAIVEDIVTLSIRSISLPPQFANASSEEYARLQDVLKIQQQQLAIAQDEFETKMATLTAGMEALNLETEMEMAVRFAEECFEWADKVAALVATQEAINADPNTEW